MSDTVSMAPQPDLPAAALRVRDAAARLGLAIDIRVMPGTTRTAEEAAAACGTSVGRIVKSLVFEGRATGRAYLLLVSGSNRVNEKGVAAVLGEALRRPDADKARALTGFAIGGIPPLGHDTPMPTYMDADLLAHDRVWAAAGTPFAVFPVAPEALRAATGAQIIAVT